jgi:hypothetical protein
VSETRVSESHHVSGLQAVVEDDGHSVWLYLRDPASATIRADCWLYNRHAFDRAALSSWPRSEPPPAPSDVAGSDAVRTSALPATLTFLWSRDGESVAVAIGAVPIGYVMAGERTGFNRYLSTSTPWGRPFDEEQYSRLFESAG